MPGFGFSFRFNPSRAIGITRKILSAMSDTSQGPVGDGFKQASARFLAYIRRRYVELSRGGGEWPDLAPSTKLRRARKTGAGRAKLAKRAKASKYTTRGNKVLDAVQGMRFMILRDTGILLNSLSTGAPGSIEQPIPGGIRVGTAINYAKYHQDGGGRLPQRTILVQPDGPTEAAMTADLKRGYQKMLDAAAH